MSQYHSIRGPAVRTEPALSASEGRYTHMSDTEWVVFSPKGNPAAEGLCFDCGRPILNRTERLKRGQTPRNPHTL